MSATAGGGENAGSEQLGEEVQSGEFVVAWTIETMGQYSRQVLLLIGENRNGNDRRRSAGVFWTSHAPQLVLKGQPLVPGRTFAPEPCNACSKASWSW